VNLTMSKMMKTVLEVRVRIGGESLSYLHMIYIHTLQQCMYMS